MISPVKKIRLRGDDPTGYGWYGAKRGKRKHQGVDLLTDPDELIIAPFSGVITKLGYVYPNVTEMRYVEITGDMYRCKLMYCSVDKINKNDRVFEGSIVGLAQNVSNHWYKIALSKIKHGDKKPTKMLNHLHYQLWKFGLLTDPEPLL